MPSASLITIKKRLKSFTTLAKKYQCGKKDSTRFEQVSINRKGPCPCRRKILLQILPSPLQQQQLQQLQLVRHRQQRLPRMVTSPSFPGLQKEEPPRPCLPIVT